MAKSLSDPFRVECIVGVSESVGGVRLRQTLPTAIIVQPFRLRNVSAAITRRTHASLGGTSTDVLPVTPWQRDFRRARPALRFPGTVRVRDE